MSSGFAPSIEQERAEGHPIVRMEYPVGLAGVKLSLEQIAQRIREGAKSAKVQGVAFDTLHKAGFNGRSENAGNSRQRAAALLDFVRSVTLYAPDPPNVEMTKSAEALLCLRPGLCVRGGDCDDMVVLLGSLIMSVGIPVLVLKQTFGSADQEHVLIEALDDNGTWFPLDPSTDMPAGYKTPASAELRIDPTSNLEVGLGNHIPEAEFIGVGAVAWRFNMPTSMHTNAVARRAGLGAPLSWETNPDGNLVGPGVLYEVAVFTPAAGPSSTAVDAMGNPTGAAWTADDTKALFSSWNVTSIVPGHATGGDFLSWIVQGTPTSAQTLTDGAGVQYITVLRQSSGGVDASTLPSAPVNPNPPKTSIGAVEVVIGMLVLGTAAGVGWGIHQRHKKALRRGRR